MDYLRLGPYYFMTTWVMHLCDPACLFNEIFTGHVELQQLGMGLACHVVSKALSTNTIVDHIHTQSPD